MCLFCRCVLCLKRNSGVAALNSFVGDMTASFSLANTLHVLETVCEDIVQILRDQENGTTTKEEVVDANSKEAAIHLPDSIPVVVNERGTEEEKQLVA
jgi:hypothetical protein